MKCVVSMGERQRVNEDMVLPLAVSELPGHLGKRHVQQSRYEFPETITTIDQIFTQAMPGLPRVWNRQWVLLATKVVPRAAKRIGGAQGKYKK